LLQNSSSFPLNITLRVCDFSHYHGSRSASGLCKHYWRWILFSKAALEGVSEVAEAVFRELKQYLTNREGSKQNKNEAFGKSNTIEELVEAIQKHGSVPPTGKVTVSQSFTAFQTPEFYVVKVKATTLAANWRFAAVNGDILVMQGMPRLRDEVVAVKYDGKVMRVMMIDESSATLWYPTGTETIELTMKKRFVERDSQIADVSSEQNCGREKKRYNKTSRGSVGGVKPPKLQKTKGTSMPEGITKGKQREEAVEVLKQTFIVRKDIHFGKMKEVLEKELLTATFIK
jgi:hypothetical protein